MVKRWTRQEEKALMRFMADDDWQGASEALGRSKWGCYGHYRYMGYNLTSRSEGRMTMDEKIAFAKDIRQTMLANDISQRILADEHGCGAEYLCGILACNGKKSLTTETADRIRASLDRCVQKAVMTGCSRRRNNMEMAAE
jgi:hypothetical protein